MIFFLTQRYWCVFAKPITRKSRFPDTLAVVSLELVFILYKHIFLHLQFTFFLKNKIQSDQCVSPTFKEIFQCFKSGTNKVSLNLMSLGSMKSESTFCYVTILVSKIQVCVHVSTLMSVCCYFLHIKVSLKTK